MMIAQVEAITKYDDSKIVVGMIICCALMFAFGIIYDKYLRPKKMQISGLQAIEVTVAMLDKVKHVTIGGSTIEKRATELHHDTKSALSSQDKISEIWSEILQEQKGLKTMIEKAYEAAGKRDIAQHKERIGLQIDLNEKILELATK